jgi:hypothetical protein
MEQHTLKQMNQQGQVKQKPQNYSTTKFGANSSVQHCIKGLLH